MIKDGDGNAERVFGEIQRYLEESKAPIKFERGDIIVRSMGYRLKPYQVFINARDYGKNLQVS